MHFTNIFITFGLIVTLVTSLSLSVWQDSPAVSARQIIQSSFPGSLGLPPLPPPPVPSPLPVLGASAVKASLTLIGSQGVVDINFTVPVPGIRLVNRFLISGSVNLILPVNNNNIRCIAVDGGLTSPVGAPFGANTGNVKFSENGGS